jgi:hypothetical protein
MTTHAVRLLAADVALVPAGIGFLMILDGWRRFGSWGRLAVALLAGQALLVVFAPLLLYAGLSVSPVVVLPFVVTLFAVGAFTDRRRCRTARPGEVTERRERAALATTVVLVSVAAVAAMAVVAPLYEIDAMLNWVMKAKVLWAEGDHLSGALDSRLFASPELQPQAHLEYPLGLNTLYAWVFHWMGTADVRVLHLQIVVLVASAVGTVWSLVRGLLPDLPLAIGLAGAVLMPAVVDQLLTAYADVPLAFVWASGAVALMRWSQSHERHLLGLATLLFAASLALKQDGTFYVAAIYVAVGGLAIARRQRRRLHELIVSAGVCVVTAAPWQFYARTHGLERRDVRPSLSRMGENYDRIWPTLEGMLEVVAHARSTLVAVPLALAMAAVCLRRRLQIEFALPFVVTSIVVLVTILLAYWNGAVSLEHVLIPALGRVMMGLIVLAWVLVPLLTFAALSTDGRRRDELDVATSSERDAGTAIAS